MLEDPKLKQAFALITEAIADAYARGKGDAINAMLAAASGATQQPTYPTSPELRNVPVGERKEDDVRSRAPRGSAQRVIKRAIARSDGKGATIVDIMSAREGELEMMLVDSSVRGELRRGEKSGKYLEIDGRWFEPA